MANGRFLSKTTAVSVQLAGLSDAAENLFFRLLPHLDRDGRHEGEPLLIKAACAPLKASLTLEAIPALLAELGRTTDADGVPLVRWYEVKGRKVLQFPGFDRNQPGLRKEREAPSRLPAFNSDATPVNPAAYDPPPPSGSRPRPRRSRSGVGPESDRSRTGVPPEEVPQKVREVEVQVEVEGKGPAEAGTPDRGGWPALYAHLLRPIGIFPPSRVGKALQIAVAASGLERSREIVEAYARFGPHMGRDGQPHPDINTPQFCSPEKLAETWGFWTAYTEPLAIAGNGNGAHP